MKELPLKFQVFFSHLLILLCIINFLHAESETFANFKNSKVQFFAVEISNKYIRRVNVCNHIAESYYVGFDELSCEAY